MIDNNNFEQIKCFNKVKFKTIELAEKRAKKHGMKVYECKICYHYHLTSRLKIMKIPEIIKRTKPLESYFGKWDNTVPCIPFKFRNESKLEDYCIQVEEYIVEQSSFEIKNGYVLLPEEFEYNSEYGLIIPDRYNI